MNGPPNQPTKGDRCTWRGVREAQGTVTKMATDDSHWVTVWWDDADKPMLCHSFELVRL